MTGTVPWSIKYRKCKLEIPDHKPTGPYYYLDLPDELRVLRLSEDDTVKLSMMDNEDPVYIQGVKTKEDGSSLNGYYDIWSSEYRLTIPKRWKNFLKKPVSYLVVEVNLIEDPQHFRIYNVDDFIESRFPEIKRKYGVDLVDPLEKYSMYGIGEPAADAVDLAYTSPYPGQTFKIIPVDPHFDPLIEEARDRENKERVCINSDDVIKVAQEHTLPSIEIEELAIGWDLSITSREDVKQLQTKFTYPNSARIKLLKYVDNEATVRLPKKGGFKIWQQAPSEYENMYWRGNTWMTHLSEELEQSGVPYANKVTSEWGAQFFDPARSDDSCIVLYLPVPPLKKGDPDVWWA